VFFDATLGLDIFTTTELKIYPIPAKHFITVELFYENDTELNLFDVSGKLVLSKMTTESTTLPVKDLPQGIYFLKVQTHEKTGTYKIIKA
jgi:hypothetical protein